MCYWVIKPVAIYTTAKNCGKNLKLVISVVHWSNVGPELGYLLAAA